MRILLCTTTFKNIRNGPTKFAHLLYNNQNKHGLQVDILTEDVSRDSDRLFSCKIGALKKILPIATVYRMIRYYRRASQLNKKHAYDYIIYNNAIYGVIHSFFAGNVVGMINDYNNQKNISEKQQGINYQHIKKNIFKQFERKAIASEKLILTNSDYLNNLLRSAYPSHASKIFRLYKGVDLKSFIARNKSNWEVSSLERIKILFVKNDFLTGGIKIVAECLANFNLNFTVTIVGPDKAYAGQIQSFFTSPNVVLEFLGHQTQEQVFGLMSTQHIFCVPSLQEALGVANLEALNAGIPVVTSDAGGIPEAIDFGNCGFMSHAGDAKSLTSCLELCLHDRALRQQKILKGFEHVKKFESQFVVNNLQNILTHN